jgi:hypothetical protein
MTVELTRFESTMAESKLGKTPVSYIVKLSIIYNNK